MKSNTIIAILAVVLAGMTVAAGALLFQQNRTQNALEASRQTSENRVRELQQQLAEMETRNNKLTAQTADSEKQITALNEQISDLESRQVDLKQAHAELKKTRTALKQAQADLLAASETVTQLKDERHAAVTEIDRLKNEAAEQGAKLAAAETALAEKTVQIKTLNSALAKAKEKTRQLQSMQDSREQQISGLKQEKAALEKAAALAQNNAAAQEKEIKVLINQIDELKSLVETRDREMGQISAKSQAMTEKMQEKITTLEYRNNRRKAQKEKLENQITALNGQISDLESRQADLKQAHAELEKTRTALKQAQADLLAASETVVQLRHERHAVVTEIDRLKNEAAEQGEKLAVAETALAKKEDQVDRLNAALVDANEKIQIYQDRLETISGTKSRIEEEFQRFKQTHMSLVTDLEQQITDKEITVDRLQERITITFIDQILFSSGRAALNRKGKKALDKVGRILKKEARDREIMVVGHTDNLPIHKDFRDKYTTNWELSAHRAASVVRYLQYKSGLDPGNLRAVGCSFYEPVAGNDTPEGRAQNRRVEIIIAPNYNMAETR